MKFDKSIDRLRKMTTELGLVQHANLENPEPSFYYSVDDSLRALVFLARTSEEFQDPKLAQVYLDYSSGAKREDGWVENYRSPEGIFGSREDGSPEDPIHLKDCYGRNIWGLAEFSGSNYPEEQVEQARSNLLNSLDNIRRIESPMSYAFAGIGLIKYLENAKDKKIEEGARLIGEELLKLYNSNSDLNWKGFGDSYTYCAARPSQSLILMGKEFRNEGLLIAGLESLEFLIDKTINEEGVFRAIGNGNPHTCTTGTEWMHRGKQKADYDEQTIEASCMTEALVDAYKSTGDEKYLENAVNVYEWFHGRNSAGIPLVKKSGAVCDGIVGPEEVNENCGGEAILSKALAQTKIYEVKEDIKRIGLWGDVEILESKVYESYVTKK